MKHPNGFGTVVKLSGKRRNQFVVQKTNVPIANRIER
jgi:hypothetical protein